MLSFGLHLPFSRQVKDTHGCLPGDTPYKSDVGACPKISRTPLKGTKACFMGVSQIHFHPYEVPIQQQKIL